MIAVNKNGIILFRSKPKGCPKRTQLFVSAVLNYVGNEVRVIMSDKDEFVNIHSLASTLRRTCNSTIFKRHVKAEERNGMVFLVRK